MLCFGYSLLFLCSVLFISAMAKQRSTGISERPHRRPQHLFYCLGAYHHNLLTHKSFKSLKMGTSGGKTNYPVKKSDEEWKALLTSITLLTIIFFL